MFCVFFLLHFHSSVWSRQKNNGRNADYKADKSQFINAIFPFPIERKYFVKFMNELRYVCTNYKIKEETSVFAHLNLGIVTANTILRVASRRSLTYLQQMIVKQKKEEI